MAGNNPSADQSAWLEEPHKLPDMLNVLTILTFIFNGIFILAQFYATFNAKKLYETAVANQEKIANAPSWVHTLQGPDPIGDAQKTYENRIPIGILSLVGMGLCIYGAIEMRRLKKTGFYLYLLGDIVPLIGGYIFIGTHYLAGIRLVLGLFFIVLFLILYATQLKYMKK